MKLIHSVYTSYMHSPKLNACSDFSTGHVSARLLKAHASFHLWLHTGIPDAETVLMLRFIFPTACSSGREAMLIRTVAAGVGSASWSLGF